MTVSLIPFVRSFVRPSVPKEFFEVIGSKGELKWLKREFICNELFKECLFVTIAACSRKFQWCFKEVSRVF